MCWYFLLNKQGKKLSYKSYLCWALCKTRSCIKYYYCSPNTRWYNRSDTDPIYEYALSGSRGEFNAWRFTIQILHLVPASDVLHILHSNNQFSGNASNLVKCWAICDIEVVNESCVGRCPLLISYLRILFEYYTATINMLQNRCIHASVFFYANQLTIDTLLQAFVFYLQRIKLKVFDFDCDRCGSDRSWSIIMDGRSRERLQIQVPVKTVAV